MIQNPMRCSAVFTEQGSSAQHMTAAKVLDVVPRLPGCAVETSDAVSAWHTLG